MVAVEVSLAEVLPPDARSVRDARALLRDALAHQHRDDWAERAQLAVSELVTNAVVHAGTDVRLKVLLTPATLRVEVADGSSHQPVRRSYSTTAGTGRGLRLVDESVDRWDVAVRAEGKTVWFEIGQPLADAPADEPVVPARDTPHEVVLLNVPLLMHWAWQEHASALLREYLLVRLDEDLTILEQHAEASDALNLLHEQLPAPTLPDDPDAIMAGSVEPGVTDERLVLLVPEESVAHFATMDTLLRSAIQLATAGELLGPPTQPEISEMREWLCTQVLDQARHGAAPVPWVARTNVQVPLARTETLERYRALAESDEPLIATDEASVIVAVTPPVVEFLGYADASELVGRRIIVVVPARFHQAHIAGTTLHMTNGRDVLLGIDVKVPLVRADGTEVPVGLNVQGQRIDDTHRVFVGRIDLGDLGSTGPAGY